MSLVSFPLSSVKWCAISPIGWDSSSEVTEVGCSHVSLFFGDAEGIHVRFDALGRVSFAKDGEYLGDKYVGAVLTDEAFAPEGLTAVAISNPYGLTTTPELQPTAPSPWLPILEISPLVPIVETIPESISVLPAPVPLPPTISMLAALLVLLWGRAWVRTARTRTKV